MMSECGQYWDVMRCRSLGLISTLVNYVLQPDSGLLRKSSGNKSLTVVNTGMFYGSGHHLDNLVVQG